MFIGLGMPIPDLSNKPGPGRPGFGPTGDYDFQFRVEGTEAVVIKANAPNNTGTFRITWPNGTTQELSGNNASITAPDATDGIVSINNEELDTTYMDDFAVIGAKGVVREVISWGKNPWNRLNSAFKDCTNLTTFGITSLQTDAFADLDFMFEGCTGLTEANLSSWNNTLGFRGRQMFKDCTNISKVTWNGVVKLVQTIAGMFNNVGSNVAAGCNFQTNNLDFRTSTTVTIGNTDTGGGGMFTNALIDADSSNISNWDFRTSIANINMFHAFRNTRVVGDDKTLNISNWKMDCTNLIQYTLMFDQFNEDPGNVRTDHNIALNMTGWQFGSGTTRASLTQAFRFSNFRKIIGLNTWTSGVVSRVDYAFQQPLFWAIQEGDNFNDTFWENSAIENGFTSMFSSHGLNLAESDWGESPNIKGLSKSPTVTGDTSVAQMFNSTRYTTTLYFDNVDIATGYGAANGTAINYHIHNIKIKKNGAVSGGVDYSNANIKFVGSSFANWATAEISFLTFGSGIDFTLMTNWTAAFNSSFPDWPLTFATNLNLTNLTTIGLSRTLTPCQADNFIRAVHDTTFAIGAPTPFSFSLASSQITNSPSVVNTKLLALAAAGYSITDGNPGTTMPFAYTGSFLINTDITPTINTSGGTFSSSDVTVNAATGTFNSSTAVNATIRYTLADGCYNEQVLSVVPPFSPFKFRVTGPISIKAQPAATGSFTIDWGDGTSQTTTGGTSIASPSYPAGTYDVQINALGDATYCDEFAIVSGQTNVTNVLDWGEKPWENLSSAFLNCTNLTSLSNTTLTTASSCGFVSAFQNCTSLQTVDLRNWDLSQGVSAAYWFKGCSNLEEIDMTNSSISLYARSDDMFHSLGTSVTNGCLFKASGVDLSSTGNSQWFNMFTNSRIKKDSTFANWVFPSTMATSISFKLVVLPMQDTTLDCSGWTTYSSTSIPNFSQVNYSYNGYTQPPTSSTGLKIDITNLNVSNVTTIAQAFYYSFQDEVVGLSTLGATNGATSMSIMFAYDKFMKFTAANNFSNAFISSLNLNTSTSLNQTFRSQGSAVPDVDASLAPNLSGLDLSNIDALSQTFFATKYSNAIDFTNVTMNANTAYNFTNAFRSLKLITGNLNSLFSKTFKVSNLAQTFRDTRMDSVIIGSNVDLSTATSFSLSFYNFGVDIASPTIEFADNVSFASANDWNQTFSLVGTGNTPLSTCQVDNFIRRLHATQPTAPAVTYKTIDFQNSSVTESPSIVRGLADTLVNTGGYILDLNSTDATIPFEYTGDLEPDTNITPTNNTGSAFTGTFTSSNSDIAVVASGTNAGLINTLNTGNATIRYTLADGCFTEQAIEVSDPFKLRILVPAGGATFTAGTVGGSGYDYNIDWGDGNSTTGITTSSIQTHAYSAGTYFVKIYSDNKDGYNGFYGNQSNLIQEVVSWGDLKWTSMERSFINCSNLTTLPSSFTLPLRSGAVGIRTREAFRGCNLTSVNLDGIKIYQDARYMLYQGLRNVQSFSMNNVEFHNASDANSGGDMFTFFGSLNTASWANFNLNNWTFNNSSWCTSGILGTTSAFNFANEEVSLSNWTFTNVPASGTMSFQGGYWAKGLARKGAASENFSLKLDNWTGTTLFTNGVNFHTAMTNTKLANFKTTNWDSNTKIRNMYRTFYNHTGNSEWEGLNQFMAHETPDAALLQQTFDLSEHKFNSASSSFNPNFLANVTTSYNADSFMKNISDTSTQSVIEAQYSGYLDFLGSMNDKCTSLSNAFGAGHFKGPIDFQTANLSNITSFLNCAKCTIYEDNKIDMSGVTIDGTTICNFEFYGGSYAAGNGITLDFNSPNISFEGMTEFDLGHAYTGLTNTYIMPPTITFSSTNFTGGLFISVNANYGKTMSTSDYGRLITAIATQTTHQNQSIRAAQNQYNGDPTLPSTGTTGPSRIGVNRTGVDHDGGTLNAIVTFESANLNITSPPTGGTAGSVGDLAISLYYTNNPIYYASVTDIFTTNNTNDSFATSLDNFSSASSGTPYYVNILTSSVAAHIKTLVVDRGWTIVDGEFDDNYQ